MVYTSLTILWSYIRSMTVFVLLTFLMCYKDEEANEDDGGAGPVYDHIQEQVTSFATRQEVEPSPLPHSDSSHPRSHDTPEPTSSNSTSVQKTVIQRPPAQKDDDENSDWDSEV